MLVSVDVLCGSSKVDGECHQSSVKAVGKGLAMERFWGRTFWNGAEEKDVSVKAHLEGGSFQEGNVGKWAFWRVNCEASIAGRALQSGQWEKGVEGRAIAMTLSSSDIPWVKSLEGSRFLQNRR